MSEKSEELCFVTFNLNSNPVPTLERCVKVNKKNQIIFAVRENIINLEEHDIFITPGKCINSFLENLKDFEAVRLCYGGPTAKMYPNASKNLCTTTSDGLLRHHECALIINKLSKATCCIKCNRLKNVIDVQKKKENIEFQRNA